MKEVSTMNRPFRNRRTALRATLLAAVMSVAFVALPGRAAAAPPTVEHIGPLQWTGITLDAGTLCEFPLAWSGTQEYTRTTFYESDGTTVAMRITTGVEQDTFSANGKTLVGDEYHFTFQSLFENGVRAAVYEYGNAERVPLPGGGVFIITGHESVTGPNVFSVDSGNDGNNVAAFCAALS
jgi:hypothetical protein